MYELPVTIKKTIAFPRLSSKNVKEYQIYGKFKDNNYTSGIRTDLIKTIPNPQKPSPVEYSHTYEEGSYTNTYYLPDNCYIDTEHELTVYVDGMRISRLHFTVNKYSKLFTINSNRVDIEPQSVISIKYFKDIISEDLFLDEDCEIYVKPIFNTNYYYGDHNIIL